MIIVREYRSAPSIHQQNLSDCSVYSYSVSKTPPPNRRASYNRLVRFSIKHRDRRMRLGENGS